MLRGQKEAEPREREREKRLRKKEKKKADRETGQELQTNLTKEESTEMVAGKSDTFSMRFHVAICTAIPHHENIKNNHVSKYPPDELFKKLSRAPVAQSWRDRSSFCFAVLVTLRRFFKLCPGTLSILFLSQVCLKF